MLDNLIDRASSQQLPAVTPMATLGALLATRSVPAARRPTLARRIRARRYRGVARAATQLALEQADPLVLARDTLLQPQDLRVHPQQNHDDRLPPRIINRLRLSALHTKELDTPQS